MTAAYVYRVYDGQERLIYIGSTTDLTKRLYTHAHSAWWAGQTDKVKALVYPDVATARMHEYAAIRSEQPRWNVAGRGHYLCLTAEQIADKITAQQRGVTAHLPTVQARIDRAAAHLRTLRPARKASA